LQCKLSNQNVKPYHGGCPNAPKRENRVAAINGSSKALQKCKKEMKNEK